MASTTRLDAVKLKRMLPRNLFLSAFFILGVLSLSARAQDPAFPNLTGHVTHAVSQSDFDVDGLHVAVGAETRVYLGTDTSPSVSIAASPTPRLGESVAIYGKLKRKSGRIVAQKIVFTPVKFHKLTGSGVIDAVLPLPSSAVPGEVLVRADGYRVLIGATTKRTLKPPLAVADGIQSNVMIDFTGRQRPDGVVVAESVVLSPNQISEHDEKLRQLTDYDPAAVAPNARQSLLSRQTKGTDPKQIPPYNNQAMQRRIEAIGARLVPKYQRDLPSDDQTRINFRFQVVDEPKWTNACTLPSGIILVPRQLVERLQNDDQIATILAVNIATALEKQQPTDIPAVLTTTLGHAAIQTAALFLPILSLPAAAVDLDARSQDKEAIQQADRVSLCLLHDAGYDLTQAPVTWWLLASSKPKPDYEIHLPSRALYLYEFLGTTWGE
jgi:hypothetical protein